MAASGKYGTVSGFAPRRDVARANFWYRSSSGRAIASKSQIHPSSFKALHRPPVTRSSQFA